MVQLGIQSSGWVPYAVFLVGVKIRRCLCRESYQPLEISLGYLKVIYISENTDKVMEEKCI